jgi:hypothetical protein
MTNPEAKDPAAMVVLASQIIAGALIAGPIPLLVIAFFIGPMLGQPPPAPGKPAGAAAAGQVSDETFRTILSYVAIGAGAMALLLYSIVPRLISSSASKSVAPSTSAAPPVKSAGKGKRAGPRTADELRTKLLPQFQTELIVRAAILEGAAFLGAVAYLLTGNPVPACVVVALLATMLVDFPTRTRVESWLERRQEKLRDDEFAQAPI